MIKIKKKTKPIPDLTDIAEEDGKKWVQTSADDLLSSKELISILSALENEKGPEDIVLAKIDFQKVNKEYYDAVVDLKAELKKQNDSLKKLLSDAKLTIDKKNKKLKELISYIKKLHVFIAYDNKISAEDIEKILHTPSEISVAQKVQVKEIEEVVEEVIVEYSEVEEILLDDDGKEIGPVQR